MMRRTLSLAAAITTLAVGGCTSGGQTDSTAFQQAYPTSIGAKPIRPGAEIGLLYVYLKNISDSTVIINSIGIDGPGIGSVVRPVQISMAPLRFGWSDYEANSVGGALYSVNPPAFLEGGACRVQALFPVQRFRMAPGSEARVWIILRALQPGRWIIPTHYVNYTLNGKRHSEGINIRAWGSVSMSAKYIPPYYAMAKCVGRTSAKFLSGWERPQ